MKVFSIDQLVEQYPFSRSGIYKAIAEKRLVARKDGRKTIILESDWTRYLESLPALDLSPSKAA
jgi:hypothetical protein